MSDIIKAYRIVKSKWAERAFDGEGARLYGGRWNSKGLSCVYCAASESLAQLEMLAHIEKAEIMQFYTLYEITLPDSAMTDIERLPGNWQSYPAPVETAEIGDEWLISRRSVALKVPSAIVPREFNVLLNPLHEDFYRIVRQASSMPLQFDERLK